MSLVCWNCFSFACPEWLGYVAQLIGVAGFQFEIPVPGVLFLVLFARGFSDVILVVAFKYFVCMVLINGLSHWHVVVGLCSTSFPGGHQVDGLPPASSHAIDSVIVSTLPLVCVSNSQLCCALDPSVGFE